MFILLNVIVFFGAFLLFTVELIAANALYDFLIEYMDLQRSLGQFDVLMTAQEREEFLNGLIQFMERAK